MDLLLVLLVALSVLLIGILIMVVQIVLPIKKFVDNVIRKSNEKNN